VRRSRLDVEGLVLQEVRVILEERGHARDALAPADALDADLGLSSLEIIGLVAKAASAAGVDPVAPAPAVTDLRTVDDLCRLVRGLVAGESSEQEAIDTLRARQDEARARRARRVGPS
jgi:hypothetical protein